MTQDSDTSLRSRLNWDVVRAFLEAEPDRLRRDPALLDQLGLSARPKTLLEFGPAALGRLEARAIKDLNARRDMESTARANYDAQSQTHAVILELMQCRSLTDLAQRLEHEVRQRFRLAGAKLCVDATGPVPSGWRALDDGGADFILGEGVDHLMGPEAVREVIFGEDTVFIGSAALVRLNLWRENRPGLIAFGSVSEYGFTTEMGTELIVFVARIIEGLASRWPVLA